MNTLSFARPRAVTEGSAPPSLSGVLAASLERAQEVRIPFRHLRFEHLLPPAHIATLHALSLPPATAVIGEACGCVAVRRALVSIDRAAAVSRTLAHGFAAETVADQIARRAGVEVADCRLALTLTQEVDGWACEPRTGEGEARYRFVVGLSPMHQIDLGPDLYRGPQTWATQLPWRPGSAFGFAPAADTWHGFEPRMIRHQRASLVVDYL